VKIAYVCFVTAVVPDGVSRKIATQAAHWRRAGHEVEVCSLSPAAGSGAARSALGGRVFSFSGPADRVRATMALARDVRRMGPDIVYLRYDRFVPPLPPALWPLPVVVEINTDDRRETSLYRKAGWLYNELNRVATLGLAAGLVCVTNELARSRSFTAYRKPTIVIANGAEPGEIPVAPPVVNERPAAVMLVGAMAPWTGVDKVIALAAAAPELDVHVIGANVAEADARLPPNVHLHGVLAPAQYGGLLGAADFGIGPLALHRKGMSEASPLKVREYLLHGLPVLTAHEDTDFPGQEPWFVLRLPNSEDNVASGLPAIRAWVASVRGRRVPREEVVERVGAGAKEAARLAFLDGLLDGAGGLCVSPAAG
jgi:glycosyltransferase involved in cell wall biosynthesis